MLWGRNGDGTYAPLAPSVQLAAQANIPGPAVLAYGQNNDGTYSPLPPTNTPSGSAGGDLSGTYPNPTVAKIGGQALTLGGALTTTAAGGSTIVNFGTSGGPYTYTFPNNNDAMMGVASVNIVTGAKSFNSGAFVLKGATSGFTTFNAAAVAGSTTITLPGATSTLLSTGGAVLAGANPANPTGTSSTASAVMAGIGGTCKITPNFSTRVQVTLVGNALNTVATDGGAFQLVFGTGTAPNNQDAATGTPISGAVAMTSATASAKVPIALSGYMTGLTPGTAYWIDVTEQSVTAGTVSIQNITCSAAES